MSAFGGNLMYINGSVTDSGRHRSSNQKVMNKK